MPSYAYLAVARAEKEKQLSIKMIFSKEKIDKYSKRYFMPENAESSSVYLQEAIDD
jgi:transcriptional accessory protein Tex/SPT6